MFSLLGSDRGTGLPGDHTEDAPRPGCRVLADPAHLVWRRHSRCIPADDIPPRHSHFGSSPAVTRPYSVIFSTLFLFYFLLQCSRAGGPAAFVPAPSRPPISPGNGRLYTAVGALSAKHVLLRLFPLCAVREPRNWLLPRKKKSLPKTATSQTRQARPPTVWKFLQIADSSSPVSLVLCPCSGRCGNRPPVSSCHQSCHQSVGFHHVSAGKLWIYSERWETEELSSFLWE